MMDTVEPPQIEFPCDYPIKVLGRATDEFEQTVLEVVARHAPGFDQSLVKLKPSRKGTFVSLNMVIIATGKPQLDAMHKELIATGLVQMVI